MSYLGLGIIISSIFTFYVMITLTYAKGREFIGNILHKDLRKSRRWSGTMYREWLSVVDWERYSGSEWAKDEYSPAQMAAIFVLGYLAWVIACLFVGFVVMFLYPALIAWLVLTVTVFKKKGKESPSKDSTKQ